ncbi:predicted protein [Aspergillus terreus NIH2624]|uniref:3'-5' exonuclease domain-containing protein n=1 Tax=Aspergillus terreus (strain NIH 2624 / FGSC A1156) TaxID=341663 RepID=Q0CRU0_ASPTN|nr:uncharacterized protein ATEG_03594 [Aspergillus terreus NIH2624]EAU35396.1 predicted protein [Aspergillus terreus NIH2624]
MHSDPAAPKVELVDSSATLRELLEDLSLIPSSSPPLFLDLEGVNLGRNGSISILSLYAVHKKTIYLVDVYKLGKAAFSNPQPDKHTSLRANLESPSIKKVLFDVRNDSDALFSHYNIRLDGIQDLQLMELATRSGPNKYVAGLAKCIERDSPISDLRKAEWKRRKDEVTKSFDPGKGGSYEVFNKRPMTPDIRDYLQTATNDRIRLSQTPEYNGQASDKVFGPWKEDSSKEWHAFFDEWEDNHFVDDLLCDELLDNGAYGISLGRL